MRMWKHKEAGLRRPLVLVELLLEGEACSELTLKCPWQIGTGRINKPNRLAKGLVLNYVVEVISIVRVIEDVVALE